MRVLLKYLDSDDYAVYNILYLRQYIIFTIYHHHHHHHQRVCVCVCFTIYLHLFMTAQSYHNNNKINN